MEAELRLTDLQQMSLGQLEELYLQPAEVEVPIGVFKGHHLAWNEEVASRNRLLRPVIHLGFKALPYGVDFDQRRWFFLDSGITVGKFEPRIGPSRWRETETVCLEYHVSRLPGLLRKKLYDEVKPLSGSLCLGFGGLNAPRGRGDIFFFALERLT